MRLLALLSLPLAACGGPPQVVEPIKTSITGKVLDGTDQTPIPNALVQTEPFVKQVFSNAEGVYSIDTGLTIGGSYRVSASREGYESNNVTIANVVEGTNTVADLVLARRAPKLTLMPEALQIGLGSSTGVFVVQNTGERSIPLSFTITAVEDWITSVSPPSGMVTTTDTPVSVRVDRSLLPGGAGEVVGSVLVTSNGGSATVPVRVLR